MITLFYLEPRVTGSLFYNFEYLDYLLKNNINAILVLSSKFKKDYEKFIYDKYDINKLHFKFFSSIIFKTEKIYKNILILDHGTFYRFTQKRIYYNKLFYNYGNDQQSLSQEFNQKNIITFGDKELGCKVQYHYPLCLNFEIFKDIKINKGIFIESEERKILEKFHQNFDEIIIDKQVWDRANRLIPECKFYNKKIILNQNFFDSKILRFKKSWKDYDIWTFKSIDTNKTFSEWLKEYL